MSLPVNAACYLCYLRRNIETARAAAGEEAATALSRDVMQLFLDAPEWASIPCFGPSVSQLLQKHCGIEADRFRQEKEQSNRFVLDRMAQLRSYVNQEPDPVYAGLSWPFWAITLISRRCRTKSALKSWTRCCCRLGIFIRRRSAISSFFPNWKKAKPFCI